MYCTMTIVWNKKCVYIGWLLSFAWSCQFPWLVYRHSLFSLEKSARNLSTVSAKGWRWVNEKKKVYGHPQVPWWIISYGEKLLRFGKHNIAPLATFTRVIENSSTNHGAILTNKMRVTSAVYSHPMYVCWFTPVWTIVFPGEPTPSSVTGGTERGRQPQQPHGGPSYYRPQSFNQALLGYPRNGPMPYGAPGVAPYGQPVVPGREPWRIDRRTPEAAPQRVPSTKGPLREEGTVN